MESNRVLAEHHMQYLLDHAITEDRVRELGIWSNGDEIVFPWADPESGLVTEQRRPWPGKPGEYYWEKGKPLHFWVHRDAGPDSPVLLVEGTKQSIAASVWAPEGYSVYGMTGCEGAARVKLRRFTGREVIVCLDKDAETNRNIYDAGTALAERLRARGAKVVFTRLSGRGSMGLDDVLARDWDEDERESYVQSLIDGAKEKVADRKPTTTGSGKPKDDPGPQVTDGRTVVLLDEDKREIIQTVSAALVEKAGGTRLFNFGDVVSRLRNGRAQPLDPDSFHRELVEHVACFHRSGGGKTEVTYRSGWPDKQTVGAVLSEAEAFPELTRVTPTPFMREDGSICTTPGYDPGTGAFLTGQVENFMVPEAPTQQDARNAVEFLMTEWLGDIPFETAADRANCLALILTPFVRGVLDLVPLAVLNGLHMGVGKNLLANCIWIMARGEQIGMLPLPQNEEEMRKQITAHFTSAPDAFVFDEAHVLEGKALALALTSRVYSDRILGISRQGAFPNRATWMALGNQVAVNGDVSRRVFHIKLSPRDETPYDRRDDKPYRHPDLEGWTREHRGELMGATLTVLRAWHVAGRPDFTRGSRMGSFEAWDRMMSGALGYAGVPEFLTDMKMRRSESDFTTTYWLQHLLWLEEKFGRDTAFVTAEVTEAAISAPGQYQPPPDLDDPNVKGYSRKLGQAYARKRDVPMEGGLKLAEVGKGHNNIKRWCITTVSGSGGERGVTPQPPHEVGKLQSSGEEERYFSTPIGGGQGSPSSLFPPDFIDPSPVRVENRQNHDESDWDGVL